MEIEKLADIIEWADGWIEGMKDGMTEEEFAVDKEVKAFEDVKKVILESMERHSVYTNALNADIVAKDAKIELMQKELDGRKAGYAALKAQLDTKYISIEEHDKIVDQFKEEVKKLNKCIMNKNESINTGNTVILNLRKEIEAHESENAKLSDRIKSLKTEFANERNAHLLTRDREEVYKEKILEKNGKINELKEQVEYLKKELDSSYKAWETDSKNHQKRDMTLVDELGKKNDEIKKLKEENSRLTARVKCDTEYWKKAFEAQSVDLADEKKLNESLRKTNDELVDTLNKSNGRIEELEEENFKLSGRVDTDFVNKLIQETDYYKEQERIRTDQLRATESKVEELYKELEGYKKESKNKSEMLRKAYVRYVDEACKSREEIMNDCYKQLTKDDTGYIGFKQYSLGALEAQEGNEETAEEFLCDTIEIIFHNKKAEEKRKEETKKELNEAFGVPCGSDSIE